MVHVINRFQLRIALLDDFIEAHAAHAREGRVQRGERLHGRVRTHMFVMVEDDCAHLVFHWHDGILEAAFFPGLGGALLGFDSVSVDIIARKAPFGGNRVCADALRGEIGLEGDLRVSRPRTASCAHGHAGHALDTAADGHVSLAGHDFCGGHVAGLEAGGTEAVDLHACGGFGIVGIQHRDTGNVCALLANGRHTAEHDVVNIARIELVAVANGLQGLRREREGGDLVQRAGALALAARGAHGVINVSFSHFRGSFRESSWIVVLCLAQDDCANNDGPETEQGGDIAVRPRRLGQDEFDIRTQCDGNDAEDNGSNAEPARHD